MTSSAAQPLTTPSKEGHARSSRRRRLVAAPLLLLASLLALALSSAPAGAAITHPYLSSFGDLPAAGLAVDQGSGDVYLRAADHIEGSPPGTQGSISRFDSTGNPVNFTASAPYISGNRLTGTPDGYFRFDQSLASFAIAPPGSPAGTSGDIYLSTEKYVLIFARSGKYLGAIESRHQGQPTGVAVDPAGNLYISFFAEGIDKYVPSANPPLESDYDSTLQPVPDDEDAPTYSCCVAASGSRVAAIDFVHSGKFFSFPLSLFPGGGQEDAAEPTRYENINASLRNARALAAEPGGTFYFAKENEIFQLDAAGNVAGYSGFENLNASGALAVNSSVGPGSGNLYAGSNRSGESVLIFGPPVVIPDVTNKAATQVGRNTVTLNGTIGAAGGPPATCKFEYVTLAQYRSHNRPDTEGFDGAASAACAPGGPFTGSATQAVSAEVSGLTTDTEYVYRLVGSNANGDNGIRPQEVLGFTTLAAVTLATGEATNLSGQGATLNATITPEGNELEECKFEYGLTAAYGQSAPCAETPAEIGTGSSPVAVHADLGSLSVGTKYHFRIAGKNATGSKVGADASFTTRGPIISGESVAGISDHSVTLKALINPNGEATGYLFEYVSAAQFAASGYAGAATIPLSGEAIGAGKEALEVSQQLDGLAAGTTYHFRALATNPSGSFQGEDQVVATFVSAPSFEACANDPFRVGLGARLPDCRAYEQASPVDKNGADVNGDVEQVHASPSGDAISFYSSAGLPGSVGAQDFQTYLARRVGGEWSTRGVYPPAADGAVVRNAGWTPDLSQFLSVAGEGFEGPRVLRTRNSADGSFTPMATLPQAGNMILAGASADGTKVFFAFDASGAQLDPAAPPQTKQLYVWDRATGVAKLAGLLPDSACGGAPPCIPAEGSIPGAYQWFVPGSKGFSRGFYVQEQHTVSADGSKVFFTDFPDLQLYARVDAAGPGAHTIRISAPQRGAPDPGGTKPAAFMRATPSGSRVFFLSCEKLTDDSTAFSTAESKCNTPDQGQDLYAYDTAGGQLTDLTVDPSPGDLHGADVKGVLGASDDGSFVYFAANGDLDGAGPAAAGNCQGGGDLTFDGSGECSLYLSHAGAISFIARLNAGSPRSDIFNWAPSNESLQSNQNTARVTPDGRTLVFRSKNKQPSGEAAGPAQFYRYRFGEAGLLCVSCNPTGAPSDAGPQLRSLEPVLSAVIPTGGPALLTRNLSESGDQFFFETTDKLVAGDTNGERDVYEWEADGAGSCHSSAQNGGCLYLISTGTGAAPAFFADASASGDDAFLFTREALVPQDKDQVLDIYDASVEGGIASQVAAPAPPPCEAEGCRGAGTGPPAPTGASSAVFQGDGNPAPKRHHKKHKKHKKKHHKKHHHKRAGAGRGGQR